MENKINVAGLLKNCPYGMELNCPMFDNLYLDKVDNDEIYPIKAFIKNEDNTLTSVYFTKCGTYNRMPYAKCVIFPKGKTTWEGFQNLKPFILKDGKLVPNKFNIKNLKPFDKVLVRSDNRHRWSIQFFERINNKLRDSFVCMGGYRYYQCIPYEGNEHLLDTAIECNNFYKNWD